MKVVPLASGSQEARFTQPLREKFALLCIVGIFLSFESQRYLSSRTTGWFIRLYTTFY